jgi:hypothetical protein
VTSPHAAVANSEYSVEMQAGLAVVSLCYVSEQTQYFALLINGNRTVPLGSEIKPPDLGAFESSDRRDRCRINCLLIREGCYSCKNFFTLIQDQDECPTIVLGS